MTAQFSAGEPPDVFYVQAEFSDAVDEIRPLVCSS